MDRIISEEKEMKKRYISFMNQILIFCSLIVVLPLLLSFFLYFRDLKKSGQGLSGYTEKSKYPG